MSGPLELSLEPLLHSLLAGARACPRQALIGTRDRVVTRAEFVSMVLAVGRRLREHGVNRGDRVLLCGPNSAHLAAAYFGVHSVGAVSVPLDADLPPQRAAFTASHCGAVLAMVDAGPPLATPTIDLRSSGESSGPGGVFKPDCRLDDAADILYTTGTTGRPKGVVLTHRNIAQAATNINQFVRSRSGDVELVPLPLGHSFGLGRLRCAAQTGATLILEAGMRNAAKVLQRLLELRATGLALVPAGFDLLLRLGKDRLGDARGHLRYVEIGSAAMRPETKRRLMELLPNTRLCHHYGLTEASRAAFIEYHAERDHLDSIGRASPNVEITIRDSAGRVLGPGETGEIAARGGMIMREYWKEPELTAAVLRDGWLYTGDRGFQDACGYFHLVGRQADLINVGGMKVSPEEIERELSGHPRISDVACVGVPDPQQVAGEVVKAFIVCAADVAESDLVAWLRGRLEEYKIPRIFQRVDRVPKTSAGKVQRHLLQDKESP